MEKKNYDYVADYVKAYQAMKEKAIEVIEKYGKEIDLRQLIQDKNPELNEDELEAVVMNECYSVFYADKHGNIYDCAIQGVRYDNERGVVEVFLHSYDGEVDEWMPASYINGDEDYIYMTILENCP